MSVLFLDLSPVRPDNWSKLVLRSHGGQTINQPTVLCLILGFKGDTLYRLIPFGG